MTGHQLMKVFRLRSGLYLESQSCQFEVDECMYANHEYFVLVLRVLTSSLTHRHPQPVKTAEERRDVDLSTGTEDQPGCRILNRLESVEQLTRQTGKCRTAVVEPQQNKRHHERLEHGPHH